MKFISCFALVFTFATSAFATINVDGRFINTHDSAQPSQDKKSCEKEGGKWDSENGPFCMFVTTDQVVVSPVRGKADTHKVRINLEDNGGGCAFDGTVQRIDDRKLEYVKAGKDGEKKEHVCIVTLEYADSDHVSVSNNGDCRDFANALECGHRADLYLDATRAK